MSPQFYSILATLTLLLHLVWILWVICGVLFTRRRPLLRMVHLVSLAWGFIVQLFPVACPFTGLEQELWRRAGRTSYEGGFITHYLERIVYPDLPPWVFVVGTIVIIGGNLWIHYVLWRRRSAAST